MNCVINSAVLATGTLAIALPVGVTLAVLISRFAIPGRRLAILCLGVLLFLPLYVQLSAWDAALGKLGWLTLAHGSLAQPLLSGMRGAIFVHGIAAIPWVAFIVGIGLMQVDPAQEEAALLIAPPQVVLWRITLPQTVPFIAGTALWTIVGTITEMTVTNIYLINPDEWTLTERFYMSWSLNLSPVAKPEFAMSLAAAVLLAAGSLWITSRWIRPAGDPPNAAKPRLLHTGTVSATVGAWLAIAVLVAIPVINLISKAGFVVVHEGSHRLASWSAAKCVGEVAAAPSRYGREIVGTIQTAGCAATLAVCVAAALAWTARRGGRRAAAALLPTIAAITVPGPMVGIALIALFNHDISPRIQMSGDEPKSWLLMLYDDTPVAPILAQAIRAFPLAIVVLWHSFAALNTDVLAAASLNGLSPQRIFCEIAIPQRWPAIAAAWLMAFAIAAGDLAWCHLVAPPGLDLLSRRIFGLVHSGVEEQVAAITLVVIISYAVLAGLALCLLKRALDFSVRYRRH